MRYLTLLTICGLFFAAAAQAEIAGTPTVVDGDTVVVAGVRLRLAGIDAPEADQTCTINGRKYRCGVVAASALKDIVAGMTVRCVPSGKSQRGVALATCYAGSYEVSGGMVFTGWALAVPRQGTRYSKLEREAKEGRRGLWAGQFDLPWKWRDREKSAK